MTDKASGRPNVLWAELALPALVCGFGTAVAMWLVGFVTHLPGIALPKPAIGLALLIPFLAGAWLTGRLVPTRRAASVGAVMGLITGLVNLLVLGSILVEPDIEAGARPEWPMVVGGFLVFSAMVGAIGATIGSRQGNARPAIAADGPAWLARFGIVAAASAIPVLLSGGLVTSTESGLAVPDWPTSYGANMFLFPLSRMTGGIYYEHAHRLFGSLVGLTVLTLMVATFLTARSTLLRAVVVGAFLIVLAQGVLGGTGVLRADAHTHTAAEARAALPAPEEVPANHATRTDSTTSRAMRMLHGITGQLTFGYLCLVAAVLSPRWSNSPRTLKYSGALRFMTAAVLGALVLQLSIGAGLRHFGHAAFLHSHLTMAVVVLIIAGLAGFKAAARAKEDGIPLVRRLGKAMTHTLGLQIVLGLVALFLVLPYDGKPDPPAGILFATAHQAVGALLLGLSVLLLAWTRRLMAPAAPAAG